MITKEQVLAKAKELGLTLTDAEVEKYVTDQKLPEAPKDAKKELISKYKIEEMAEIVLDTRAEAKERRHESTELKKTITTLETQLAELKSVKGDKEKTDLQLAEITKTLGQIKEAEKRRRQAMILKIDEKKRPALQYLENVDAVTSDQFDMTLDALGVRGNGVHGAPTPGGPDDETPATREETAEMKRTGLPLKAVRDIEVKRKKRKEAAKV